ncbi:hypothetical protein [Novacetimonas hansenii]|uniref:hypothetical protein n=1 Tax=Novacetimonas hansenii TaxID=436 RepID=UPI00248DB605|nr:hypothetical protein [Novacetimonas hansenii]
MKRFLLAGVALALAGGMVVGGPAPVYARGGGGGWHGGDGGGRMGGGWHGGGGRWRNVDGWRGGGWSGRGWGWGWGGGYPMWGWGGWGYPYGWGWGWGGYGLGVGTGMAIGAAAVAASRQAAPGIYNGTSGSGPEDDSVYDAELNSLYSEMQQQQQSAPPSALVPSGGSAGLAGARGTTMPATPMQNAHTCPKGQVYNDLTENCDQS